ncbi:MAG: hypothetical protein ACI4PW_03420 [Alphaproteobacteria bacterium]
MKNNAFLFLLFLLTACAAAPETAAPPPGTPFYEQAYALPVDAREWARNAPLKDLCQGTKNWRHKHIREAALEEIKARDIDTRECYYTGMELTP